MKKHAGIKNVKNGACDFFELLIYLPGRGAVILLGSDLKLISGKIEQKLQIHESIKKTALRKAGVELSKEKIKLLNNGEPLIAAQKEKVYLAYAEAEHHQILEPNQIFWGDKKEAIARFFIHFSDLRDYRCKDIKMFALLQILAQEILIKLLINTLHDMNNVIKSMILEEKKK